MSHQLSRKANIGELLPAGVIVAYGGTVIPIGWLLCNGSTFNPLIYPNLFIALGNSNTLPDLRGYFIRGLDNGAGRDIGRIIGSAQVDSTSLPNNQFTTNMAGDHTHLYSYVFDSVDAGALGFPVGNNDGGRENRATSTAGAHSHIIIGGDPETRPINVALNYIISAS